MLRALLYCVAMLLAAVSAGADPAADDGEKQMSGMAIVGNDDAPKSLVIVPWKSSALGDALAVSRALDAGRQPVDRDVFMRELEYYQIRESPGAESSGAQ